MWWLPFLALGTAEASPHPVERPLADSITVSPGATCLDERAIEAHVATWLGRSRVWSNVRVSIRGDAVRANAAVYSIARDGKIRERRFDPLPASCAEAQAVLGLAVALAVDGSLLRRLAEDAGGSPVFLTTELAGGVEAPYGLSLGTQVGIDWRVTSWLGLRGDGLFQYSWGNRVESTRGTFDAMVFAGALRACGGGFVGEDIRLDLCVGSAGGVLRSAGHGYAVSRTGIGPWLVALSGLRVGFSLGLRWVLDVDVVSPLLVPPIAVEQGAAERTRNPILTGLLVGIGPAFDL